MTEKKQRRVSKIITRMVSAYALSQFDTEDALRIISTVSLRLLVGVCRRTTYPFKTFVGLAEIVKDELEKDKEKEDADRDDTLARQAEGLLRTAGEVQEGNGKELQTTPTT